MDVEIVMAVGHLAQQLKDYISFVHHDRKVTYIEVDNYSKLGSGPGYSLLQCKSVLNCPFIFTSIDTIIDNDYVHSAPKEDWVGINSNTMEATGLYVKAEQILGKNRVDKDDSNTYFIGIAGVKDYEGFWDRLEKSKSPEVIPGLNPKAEPKTFKWIDTGNEISYANALSDNREIVQRKKNQALFIDNKKVVKFFSDPEIPPKLQIRSQLFPFSPNVVLVSPHMIGYDYIPGKLLSEEHDPKEIEEVINELLMILKTPILSEGESKLYNDEDFWVDCHIMYKVKTFQRIKEFEGTAIDNITSINGTTIIPVRQLLSLVDWKNLNDTAQPTVFHGDLQPENIIIADNGEVFLIDWRDSFGDNILVGDRRYDLAKFLHACVVSGKAMRDRRFTIEYKNSKSVNLALDIPSNLLYAFKCLTEHLNTHIFKTTTSSTRIPSSIIHGSTLHGYSFTSTSGSAGSAGLPTTGSSTAAMDLRPNMQVQWPVRLGSEKSRDRSLVSRSTDNDMNLLIGLQYLGIASLYLEHDKEYAQFLFLLGKYYVTRHVLRENLSIGGIESECMFPML